MRCRHGATGALAALLLVAPAACSSGSVSPQRGTPPRESGTARDAAVHLTAAGDYAAEPTTARVLTALRAGGSDAHFALGDLSYGSPGEERRWCAFVTQHVGAGFPFELLAGNHESNGLNGAIDRFVDCLPNRLPGVVGDYARQYHVDLPHGAPLVRVVMISPALTFADGTWHYRAGSPRYAWTERAIDGARARGIPWVVVGMHQPCLSVGRYSCTIGPELLHLLVSKPVDLVLTGHEHLYARTKQLREGPGCRRLPVQDFAPGCVADSDATMVAGAGAVFATVGTGGVPLRGVEGRDPERGYFAATSGANRDPTYGYADVRITATELRFSFVRGAGGTFTDSWVLRRGPTP